MVCGCCCNGEEKEPEGAWLKQDGRWCTDFIFLIAFIASFGLTGLIIQLAAGAGGNPDKIVKPVDWQGQICGLGIEDGGNTIDMTARKFGGWPDPTKYDLIVCLSSCAETALKDGNSFPKDVPAPGTSLGITHGGHWIAPYASVEVFHWCIPDLTAVATQVPAAASNGVEPSGSALSLENAASWASDFTDALADLINSAGAIGIAGGLSLVISFVTVFLVGKFVKCLVYSLLLGVILFGFLMGYLIFDYGNSCELPDCTLSADEMEYAKITGYVLWGITGLFAIIMFALRKRVQIAIEVVKESAHAIQDMPFIMLFPFVPVIVLFGYLAFWIYGATVIAGVTVASKVALESKYTYFYWADGTGGLENQWKNDGVTEYTINTFDSAYQMHAAWHFFHFLWVFQFFIYFCYLVFAGATADWYFSYTDDDGNKIRGDGRFDLAKWPIAQSCKRSMLHHIGTVALTSLIIAIIQFIRALVHYIEQQTKGEPPNTVQKLIFKCIHCCLWLLECCMDKINKNALIWTAIWGDGFCTAACSSFQLLWANVGRVAAINVVAHLIVAVSKWFVAFATASVGTLIIMYVEPYKTDVSSPVMPGILMFLIGYFVGDMFFSVFNAVIDCVFLCFLVDDKFNKATDKGGEAVKMFASKNLRELVDKYAEESEEQGKHHEKKRARRSKTGKVAAGDDDDAGKEEEPEEVEMTSKKKKKKKKKNSD